jgi:hypothetical protein
MVPCFGRDVPVAAEHERPKFVGLNATAWQVAQGRILVRGADRSGRLRRRMMVPFAIPNMRTMEQIELPSTRAVRTAARLAGVSLFIFNNLGPPGPIVKPLWKVALYIFPCQPYNTSS